MERLSTLQSCYKNKTVLVTGATGFKGSWLALLLKSFGARVVGLSLPPYTNQDNFVICGLDLDGINKVIDIRKRDEVLSFVQEIQPEIVFHLAAQPLVIESYHNPSYTFETNVIGTVNVLEAIRTTTSVKSAVIVTSDKCYKNNEWVWGYRENEPMGGNDPYSASKGCAELVTDSYLKSYFSKLNKANVATARAGNVIGGGDWCENRIVPDFFRAVQRREPLVLRNPNATRPWQFVLEPLVGYLVLAEKLFSTFGETKEFQGGWNFGPTIENNVSVEKLIQSLLLHTPNATYKIKSTNEALHEAHLLYLDTTKARKLLQFEAVLSFEETTMLTSKTYNFDAASTSEVVANRMEVIDFVLNKFNNT